MEVPAGKPTISAEYPGFATTTTSPGTIAVPGSCWDAAETAGKLPTPARTRILAIRMNKSGLFFKRIDPRAAALTILLYHPSLVINLPSQLCKVIFILIKSFYSCPLELTNDSGLPNFGQPLDLTEYMFYY
jgi:hypothetical protein